MLVEFLHMRWFSIIYTKVLLNRKDVSGANHIEQFYSEVVATHVLSSFSLTFAH